MKIFKRILTLLLVAIMAISTFGTTTAFAAEQPTYDTNAIRLFEIRKDSKNITATSPANGGTFSSSSNEIRFELRYSKANTIVAVRLHDQATGQTIQEWQTSSGSLDMYVNVTPGHSYYFEYLVAYGSGTVSITNTIYRVSRS